MAYGQLVVGDINNQRGAISYSTDNLLSKNNLKQVVTRFVCVRITDDVPREIHKRNFKNNFMGRVGPVVEPIWQPWRPTLCSTCQHENLTVGVSHKLY